MIYKQNSGTTIAGLGRGGIDEKVTMQETEKSVLLAQVARNARFSGDGNVRSSSTDICRMGCQGS